jgi:hypothetical protein
MFNSDTFANRPAFGIVGRIFISIDTAAIYRDTGTAWDLIADGGSASTNIYNSNGTLSANRTVASGGFSLTFNPSTTFDTTLTAASNTSSLAIFGVNRLSYAGGFSSNNIGNLFGGSSSFNLQTFAGSATFANSNIAANSSINSVDFSTGGSTITMTQATGLRVMAGHINMFQYQGTNSGTITHAAVSQNLGFYRPTAATGILTITNAYGHLINDLNDYGAGFTFTNRWGIYQAGASDKNYFAANVLIGTSVDSGQKLIVNGTCRINGQVNIFDTTQSSSSSTGCLVLDGGLGLAKNIFSNGNIISNGGTLAALNGGSIEVYNSGSSNYFDIKSVSGNFALRTNVGVGAVNALTVTSTGNLLVGTTTDAGQKLQVTGTAYISSSLGIGVLTASRPLDVNGTVRIADGASLEWGGISTGIAGSSATNFILLVTNSLTRMTIKATGVINLSNVPSTSVGLVSGDIFQTSGVLNIVP